MSSDADDAELLSDLDKLSDISEADATEALVVEDADAMSDGDSDKELQVAFKKGLLKPGLNVAFDAPRTTVNNVAVLKHKLSECRQSLKWPGRLDIIPAKAQLANSKSKKKKGKATLDEGFAAASNIDGIEDIDDDYKREMTFCHLAQLAVLEAVPRLHVAGVATKRPDDYFAEMVKSDAHMQRIRQKLVQKKAEIEVKNRARQLRQLRKESKFIQQEVLKRRQAEKKMLNEATKKFSKDAQSKEELEAMLTNKKGGQQQQQQAKAKKKGPAKVNKRRDWKNKKFGYGGQKKRSKWNTSDSVDDFSKKRKGTAMFAKGNQNKSSSGRRADKKKHRPGKVTRQRQKGSAGSKKR